MATRRRTKTVGVSPNTPIGTGGIDTGVGPVSRGRGTARRRTKRIRGAGTQHWSMPRGTALGTSPVSAGICDALQKLGLLQPRANAKQVTAAIDLALGAYTT